jgi:metal-dependent hydrolase (beta-lactamase superfamily II)
VSVPSPSVKADPGAEHVGALRLRHRHADHLGGARHAQRDRACRRQRQHLVVHRPGLAAADVDDELRDALDVLTVSAGSTPRSKRWPASVVKL